MSRLSITTLFLDIGGVLLTNGWDTQMRMKAAQVFNLDLEEINKRHALLFDTYEIGKISLNDYVQQVVFYEPRSFSIEAFKTFMFDQSQPYQDMLHLMKKIKQQYGLRVVAISNEGRELMDHRIKAFKLKELIEVFIVSAFVNLRKPDIDIYRMAIDLAQVSPQEVLYIDDRPLLVEIGQKIGFQTIRHQSFERTKEQIEQLFKNQ